MVSLLACDKLEVRWKPIIKNATFDPRLFDLTLLTLHAFFFFFNLVHYLPSHVHQNSQHRYTFWVACRLFVSVDDPIHVAELADSFNRIAPGIMSVPIDLPGTPFNKAIKASKFIKEKLLKIIRQRKEDLANGTASLTQDILSHMLSSCDENGQYMNEHYIADKILGLLIGGHDTASSACTFVVKYLAELPPNIYENVYQGMYESFTSSSLNKNKYIHSYN